MIGVPEAVPQGRVTYLRGERHFDILHRFRPHVSIDIVTQNLWILFIQIVVQNFETEGFRSCHNGSSSRRPNRENKNREDASNKNSTGRNDAGHENIRVAIKT